MDDDNVIPFPGDRRGLSEDDLREVARDLIDKMGSPQEAMAALMATFGVPGPFDFDRARRRPTLFPRRSERVAFVVRVDLDECKPPIWRRLRLASDLTLSQVHDILQVAMGWTDSHLHQFLMGPKTRDYSVEPFLSAYDLSEGEEGVPEAEARLDEVLATVGDKLFYEYDFGDSWWHTIRLEKVLGWPEDAPEAECLAGRRACPPEDVGGIGGYAEALDVLAGRAEPEEPDGLESLLAWLPDGFDPDAFSVEETNELLATAPLPLLELWSPAITELIARAGVSAMSDTGVLIRRATAGPWELDDEQVESATHRYRHLLATVGPGIKLTAAGYLPPRIVDALYRDLEMDDLWVGKGNREDQTYPVFALRESATALGLLRKSRGQLLPTKAAQQLATNPRRLLAHIGSRLPLGRPHERDAGLLALLFAAAGTPWMVARSEAAPLIADIGWQSHGDLEWAVYQWGRPTTDVLDNLVDSDESADLHALVARALLRRP